MKTAPFVFDGNNFVGYNNYASNCYFGITVPASYVGVLSQVKFFMN